MREATLRHGTGIERYNDLKYQWAQFDGWRVVRYVVAGGVVFSQFVDGIGWTIDANDEMPESIGRTLCRFAGVPADVVAIIYDDEKEGTLCN